MINLEFWGIILGSYLIISLFNYFVIKFGKEELGFRWSNKNKLCTIFFSLIPFTLIFTILIFILVSVEKIVKFTTSSESYYKFITWLNQDAK